MQPIASGLLILASLSCMLAHRPLLKSAAVLFGTAFYLTYRSAV
jgi:hypothetical protein